MAVTTVAEYAAEAFATAEIEGLTLKIVLEIVLREYVVGRVGEDVSTDEDDVSMEVDGDIVNTTELDELEDGTGAGITTVTGGEFTSMMEYPVVVTVAGEGVRVTTTVWTVSGPCTVFVEMM